MSPSAAASVRPEMVQHIVDRNIDLVLAPLWWPLQPLSSLVNYVGLSLVRLHMRMEGMRTDDVDGRGQPLQAVVRAATAKACQALGRAFEGHFRETACPEAIVVRGTRPHLASFPLGLGRRSLLVFTEPLARELKEAELSFLAGCEIGRLLLRHGSSMPGWAVLRTASDVTVLPRLVAAKVAKAVESRNASAAAAKRPRAPRHAALRRRLMQSIDGFAELCDLYRGVRMGRWPGLTDIDVGALAGPGAAVSAELRALDTAAALCTKARAPGLQWALGTAALGGALPRVAGRALDWSDKQERDCQRALQAAAWGLSVWSAKLRTEVLSSDRVGLLAAGGDEAAAVRAMVFASPHADDKAMAALMGIDELVEQAVLLDRFLPQRRFAWQPSLPTRIAELTAWAASPEGEVVLGMASPVSWRRR